MHYTTRRFWQCYRALPKEVQKTAELELNEILQQTIH